MVGVGSHIPYQLLRYKNLKTTEKCLRSPQQQETAEKKPDLYDHIADNATHIIICDELSSGWEENLGAMDVSIHTIRDSQKISISEDLRI